MFLIKMDDSSTVCRHADQLCHIILPDIDIPQQYVPTASPPLVISSTADKMIQQPSNDAEDSAQTLNYLETQMLNF